MRLLQRSRVNFEFWRPAFNQLSTFSRVTRRFLGQLASHGRITVTNAISPKRHHQFDPLLLLPGFRPRVVGVHYRSIP
jgi:hypothetical protein